MLKAKLAGDLRGLEKDKPRDFPSRLPDTGKDGDTMSGRL